MSLLYLISTSQPVHRRRDGKRTVFIVRLGPNIPLPPCTARTEYTRKHRKMTPNPPESSQGATNETIPFAPDAHNAIRVCGKSVAIVLATDFGTTPFETPRVKNGPSPLAREKSSSTASGTPRPLQRLEGATVTSRAVACALHSHFAKTYVLAGGSKSERALLKDSVCNETRGNVIFLDFDAEQAYRSSVDACGFALYDIPKGILDYAAQALSETPNADSVVLLGCDQVRITTNHIMEICRTFREDPSLDVVASWIQFYRRTPMLIARTFLESLGTSQLCKPELGGIDRPVASIHMKDVVFGDEKLAANDIVPSRVSALSQDATISAREAVHYVRQGIYQDSQPSSSPARNRTDEELIEIARQMVLRTEAWKARLPSSKRQGLERADEWAWRNREDFPLLNDESHRSNLAYLDSAATTQHCFRALAAESTFIEHENANVYRGGYELSKHATERLDHARETLERFIGAGHQEVAFTANASASCNIVATAWGNRNIGRGDVIAVALSEHHSNLLPWVSLAQRKGATVEYIPILPNGQLDLDTYERILAKKPKIVCIAGVSNTLGIINPVSDLVRKAHDMGARFMLDAAQSLPHVPTNMKEIGCDFAAFSAHKMYGPLGIGGLYLAPDAAKEMEPIFVGGGTVSYASTDGYRARGGAAQYETGTPPISQAIGWEGALEYLSQLGMGRVLDHSEAMTEFAVSTLHDVEGLSILGDHTAPYGAGGLISFSLPGVSPAHIGKVCGALGVAIRSGGHCAMPLAASAGLVGTGRASFAVHTTCEDVEALAVAVEMCRRLYR